MTFVLGLDTGGTFTDAALLDTDNRAVLATAKSLTTRADLSIGVGKAIAAVLEAWDGAASQVGRVTLSTTLATNAVVEGVGGRVGLILIGFDDGVLSRAGLGAAIGSDPVIPIAGGHKPDGHEQAAVDLPALTAALANIEGQVSGFAVAGYFATRNPGHEVAVRDLLATRSSLPVTCSHELSDALGGPRRAVTTVLNARLISLLDRLVQATGAQMERLGLGCDLMVVKGDGSLLRADYARARPVETVLSGPAASLSGAAFLAGCADALVADIGGTTTDIARLRGGAVQNSADGAMVGGWRTNVEAAQIRTSGLGGDSEVRANNRSMSGGVALGPRRAVPLSLLALDYPQIKEVLREQAAQAIALATDGRFVQAQVAGDGVPDWLTRSETKLMEALIKGGVVALAALATTQVALGAVDRLIRRGLVMQSCFTPTDAVHVLGRFDGFDGQAAGLGAALLARQKSGTGEPIAADGRCAAQMVIDRLTARSAVALMDAALADDRAMQGKAGADRAGTGARADRDAGDYPVSSSPVLRDVLSGDGRQNGAAGAGGEKVCGAVQVAVTLGLPLVGLGASAATYYPAIAQRLGATLIVPDHAGVAGAVGAAAGAVRQRTLVVITQPADGMFRAHLAAGPHDSPDLATALAHARGAAKAGATARAKAAGATGHVAITLSEVIDEVPIGPDKQMFLQAVITAEAEAKVV